MKYFKKVNQFINLCNIVIKRYDNDLTDSDTTVHSRFIKLYDIFNNSFILFFSSKKQIKLLMIQVMHFVNGIEEAVILH